MNGGHQCTNFFSVCSLWTHLFVKCLLFVHFASVYKGSLYLIPILYLEKCQSENCAFTLSWLVHPLFLNGLASSKSDHFLPQYTPTLTLLDHSLSIETPASLWLDHLLALNSHARTWTIFWCCFIVIRSFLSNLQNLFLTNLRFWLLLFCLSGLFSHASVRSWVLCLFTNAFYMLR